VLATTTIDVTTTDPDFGSLVAARTEATLQFSDATGESLLRIGPDAWSVDGSSTGATASLQRLRDRNLPRVAWVASARPKSPNSAAILLQVHEFPAQYFWPEEVDIGVDDQVVEQVRQKLGRKVSATEAIQWLNDRFVLRSEDGDCRVFLSGSPTPETDQRGVARPQNDVCDTGAYEFVGDPPPFDDIAPETEFPAMIAEQDTLETMLLTVTPLKSRPMVQLLPPNAGQAPPPLMMTWFCPSPSMIIGVVGASGRTSPLVAAE
jgi:hypothetical protein